MPRYSARWLAVTTGRIATQTSWSSFDPDAHVTVFDYVGVKEYIASLFLQPVDVIDREALKPHLRRPSARDAVYAF